jgi:predicted  nucleic acid-binding Zn-ribbon protein
MTSQLETLIALQDLDLLLREVRDPARATHEESLGFALANVEKLERTREKLTQQLDAKLLHTYERISRRFVRAVVPVDGSVCLGCFMGLPTATARKTPDPSTIEACENCGRILYRI